MTQETEKHIEKKLLEKVNSSGKIYLIKDINNMKINSALLISHGGTIGTILEEFYDNSKNFYTWQPSFGQGYKITVEFLNNKFEITKVEDIKNI